MKKRILFLIALMVTVVSFGQQERELKLNKQTDLIEVIYYHDNGVVSQIGAYTLEGKLQGEWLGFDTEGNKVISANYDNGKKVGKWFFWNDITLKEVDYKNNVIASISERTDKKVIAVRHYRKNF